jgi:alanyl-tRNA synthetase
MTVKRYLDDPTLSGTVRVVDLIDGDKKFVRLAETWFHPQGGGQKADRGVIGEARVVHVTHAEGGAVDHHVEDFAGLAIGGEYPFAVDVDWRRLNAAYHTAGHLIGALVEAQGGFVALAGHQWPGEARVEFDGEGGEATEVQARLVADLATVMAAGAEVAIEGDPRVDRAIRIGAYPPIPCGGTHVSRLADIGDVRIDAVKRKSGRLRVSYTVTVSAGPSPTA